MNIFEENKMNDIKNGRLYTNDGELIATCNEIKTGYPLNTRKVRALQTAYWDDVLIEQGTITKVKYYGFRDIWYLLVNNVFIPFDKSVLENHFEAVNP